MKYNIFLFNSGPHAPSSNVFKEDTSESDEDGKLPDLVSEVVEISSDSELERSVIEMEMAVSLEFSESD